MSRPARLQAEDCFYHITSRGDDRKPIFKSERDCQKFLGYLALGREKYKYYVHAYCLMTNHYHIFLETTQANLSRIMQYLNTSYTIYYNVKRKRCGHLFQGRYKSIIVEKDAYYAELTRYIHLNPVRAKTAASPEKYPWSSYNAYLSGKSDACIDIERIKKCLSISLRQYKSFVESAVRDCQDSLKQVYAGFILGRVKFIKDKLDYLKNDIERKDFAHKKLIASVAPEDIIEAVGQYYKITLDELRYGKKRPLLAKKAALYLLRRKTMLTNQEIGKMFSMKHSTVSMAALDFEKKLTQDKRLKDTIDKIIWKLEV